MNQKARELKITEIHMQQHIHQFDDDYRKKMILWRKKKYRNNKMSWKVMFKIKHVKLVYSDRILPFWLSLCVLQRIADCILSLIFVCIINEFHNYRHGLFHLKNMRIIYSWCGVPYFLSLTPFFIFFFCSIGFYMQ